MRVSKSQNSVYKSFVLVYIGIRVLLLLHIYLLSKESKDKKVGAVYLV